MKKYTRMEWFLSSLEPDYDGDESALVSVNIRYPAKMLSKLDAASELIGVTRTSLIHEAIETCMYDIVDSCLGRTIKHYKPTNQYFAQYTADDLKVMSNREINELMALHECDKPVDLLSAPKPPSEGELGEPVFVDDFDRLCDKHYKKLLQRAHKSKIKVVNS